MSKKKTYEELEEYIRELEAKQKSHESREYKSRLFCFLFGNEMPEDFIIKKFITANRAEVRDMCLTEYNETEAMELQRQEGLQEGLQKGLQKGKYETMLLNIRNLMDSTGWSAEKTMDVLKVPLNQRPSLYDSLTKD